MAAKKAKPKSSKAARAPTPAVALLADRLAETAWLQADAALAEALADLDEAETAASDAARAEALAMLAQSLSRAARKRGLDRIGALGAREPFDKQRHDLIAAGAKTPATVLIRARGVARGGEVLLRARVTPLRRMR